MCGFNRKREGDWSDGAVVMTTDRTQSTIELINRIEMLEKKLEIAVVTLELIENKADKFNNTCGFIEQLDDIKATCQESLYYIKELNNANA